MTKIIHPYQLLEAPQVNILNNNIVEDVNYSYENSRFEKKSKFDFRLYDFNIVDFRYVGRFISISGTADAEYNPIIYDIRENAWLNGWTFKFDIDTSGFVYNDDLSTINMLNPTYSASTTYDLPGLVQDFKCVSTNNNGVITLTCEDVTARAYSEDTNVLATFTLQKINENKLTVAVDIFTAFKYDNRTFSAMTFDCSFQFEELVHSSVQVDTNSNLSIQSNELMQQDTKVNDTTQISEYIADNIKTHYADGKATISMQVVDDGTQEYDVHDIVLPIIQTKFGIDTFGTVVNISDWTIDNYDEYTVTYSGSSKFITKIGNQFVWCCNCTYSSLFTTTSVLYSTNLQNWTVAVSGIDNHQMVPSAYAENGVMFFNAAINSGTDYLYYSKGLSGLDDLKKINFQTSIYVSEIVYNDGYYYIIGYDYSSSLPSILYAVKDEDLTGDVDADILYTSRLHQLYDLTFFNGDCYMCGRNRTYDKGIIVKTVDGSFGIVQEIWFEEVSALWSINSNSNSVVCGDYYSTDGRNWQQKTSGSDLVNKEIDAYISIPNTTRIRYSTAPQEDWVDVELGSAISSTSYNNILFSDSGVITFDSTISVVSFYGNEHPLLTNADGTPKEFEITSSELVYDGLTYYNLEAVEST